MKKTRRKKSSRGTPGKSRVNTPLPHPAKGHGDDPRAAAEERCRELAVVARLLCERRLGPQGGDTVWGRGSTHLSRWSFRRSVIAPPYSHLDFECAGQAPSDVSFDSWSLRLANHHDQPGLVLFNLPGSTSFPLACWRESGSENGMRYMLVFPGHRQDRKRIDDFNGSDFYFLRFLIQSLSSILRREANGLPGSSAPDQSFRAWVGVAERLAVTLQSIPERLRCDSIHLEDVDQQRNVAIQHLHLKGVSWKDRFFPELAVVCRSRNGGVDLEILLPNTGQPCVDGWPVNADGELDSSLKISLGPWLWHPFAARVEWRRRNPTLSFITTDDRHFLACLVRELPRLCRHAANETAINGKLNALAQSPFLSAQRWRAARLMSSWSTGW